MTKVYTFVLMLILSLGLLGQAIPITKTGLPPGLTLSSTGLIAGTPAVGSAGSYTFNVVACDSEQPAQCSDPTQLTLIVYPKVSVTTTSPLPPAIEGKAYSLQLNGTGGIPPLTWATQ